MVLPLALTDIIIHLRCLGFFLGKNALVNHERRQRNIGAIVVDVFQAFPHIAAPEQQHTVVVGEIILDRKVFIVEVLAGIDSVQFAIVADEEGGGTEAVL